MTSFLHLTAAKVVSYYSYWSGVVSRASDSKLRNTSGRQIHGWRCCAVFVWAGIFSSGKISIFCRYTLVMDVQMEKGLHPCPSHTTHTAGLGLLVSGYAFKSFKTDLHIWSAYLIWCRYDHVSSFIYLVNPSGFSAKHTTLLGFVELLNNILRCCDQSNRNTAHSTESFVFSPSAAPIEKRFLHLSWFLLGLF